MPVLVDLSKAIPTVPPNGFGRDRVPMRAKVDGLNLSTTVPGRLHGLGTLHFSALGKQLHRIGRSALRSASPARLATHSHAGVRAFDRPLIEWSVELIPVTR